MKVTNPIFINKALVKAYLVVCDLIVKPDPTKNTPHEFGNGGEIIRQIASFAELVAVRRSLFPLHSLIGCPNEIPSLSRLHSR